MKYRIKQSIYYVFVLHLFIKYQQEHLLQIIQLSIILLAELM